MCPRSACPFALPARALALLCCLLSLLLPAVPACAQSAADPVYVFHTNVGDMNVQLFPDVAPQTVANFLQYVNSGAYNRSLFHRSVNNFIVQGGGYFLTSQNQINTIAANPPVVNEFHLSNTRGTLAMAKLGNDPNSATSQWFFNEADGNAANLDNQNGGFTVFGRVADAASLAIMDKLAAVPVPNPSPFSSPLDQIPLMDYQQGASVQVSNLVLVSAITPLRFDFDGDSRSDLVWHNTATGQALVWDMNDQAVNTYGAPFATVSDTHWTIAGVADVNGDGRADLLWQNTQTGQVLFWLMGGAGGTQVLSYGSPFATVSDTHWRVAGMADMDGDGHPDLLWENTQTGQLLVWYMNGSTVVSYGNPFAAVSDTHWQVAGIADFDSDGHPDLLWENSATGDVLVWNLGGASGTSVLNSGSPFATVSDTAWHIVGTSDSNRDDHPDLVWQNTQTGQTLRWLLGGASGTQVMDYGSPFATVSDTHWQVVGVH